MPKYHISLSGEPAACKARTNPCPRSEHYDDLETAQHVAELAHEAFERALVYPRANKRFSVVQANLFWYMDQGFGGGASPYLAQGLSREASNFQRQIDYGAGFEVGLIATDNSFQDAALTGYRRERLESDEQVGEVLGVVDDTAFKLGFARAQRVKDADRDEFVTENISDRGLRAGQAREKYATARLLQQPFKRGQKIVVPAGTKYHSWDADGNDVNGELKEAREIEISDTFDSWIDGASDWVHIHPAQVSYAGPHGYWRDIVLTPEIVAANGKGVYEASIGMEEIIREPLYTEISR